MDVWLQFVDVRPTYTFLQTHKGKDDILTFFSVKRNADASVNLFDVQNFFHITRIHSVLQEKMTIFLL